jgi:hypothetical protein
MFKYILEIKNRLFLLLFTCVSTLVICYLYKETLIFLLVKSNIFFSNNFYFIFTNVTEIFSVYIQYMLYIMDLFF